MHIQTLKLLVTEQDLNDLVARHLPDDQPLENLTIRLGPEGVTVAGEYPLFVRVAFETLWELGTQGGKAVARLASLKAMGLPALNEQIFHIHSWLHVYVDGKAVSVPANIGLDQSTGNRPFPLQWRIGPPNQQDSFVLHDDGAHAE